MAEAGTIRRDDRAGDWNGQLARFVMVVSEDAIDHRVLDPLEEEALEMLVRALLGVGALRKPSVDGFEEWVAVLERLRGLGYLRGSGSWYHPTLSGIRRGLLLIREPVEVSPAADLRCTCKMLTRHSGSDPTPDVECGAPAFYVFTKDPTHVCCALCYAMMGDDPEVQSEYMPIADYTAARAEAP